MRTDLPDDNAISLDWETYYSIKDDYSLSCMPTKQYVDDKRFDPYLVAMCGPGLFDPSRAKDARDLYRENEDGTQLFVGRPERFNSWDHVQNRIVVAHNAGFDQVVAMRCEELGIIPKLNGVQWHCTADLTAYLMVSRSLKDAMFHLYGKEISKAVRARMDGRHDYELDEKEYADLVQYGGDDALECYAIWRDFASEWPEVERAISCQNREAIIRGFRIDREYAEESLKCLRRVQAEALADIPWVSELNPKTNTFYQPGSLPALREAVSRLGIEPPPSFKKDDPRFLEWTEQHGTIPFIAARTKYAGTVQHIARIETLVNSADENDIVRPGLIYFGAATGRFSAGLSDESAKGSKNVNMLNLPRSALFKDDPQVMNGEGIDMRGMYIPRPGHKFVIFDYSQIEARFSLWLVNDTQMMEAMAREGNLYQAASVSMGWSQPGDKIKKTDPDKYRLAKCCLTGDTLVLVRSEKFFGKGLTHPYYKRIILVTVKDWVWDGHDWVKHLGVEKIKEVKPDELIETGGVCLTKDHKVYINDTESRRADEVFGDTEAAAISWGQANNPVRGWSHVWVLASALIRVSARAFGLCAREALHLLASALRLHRMRNRGTASVGQCSQGTYHEVHEVRSQDITEKGCTENMGKDA